MARKRVGSAAGKTGAGEGAYHGAAAASLPSEAGPDDFMGARLNPAMLEPESPAVETEPPSTSTAAPEVDPAGQAALPEATPDSTGASPASADSGDSLEPLAWIHPSLRTLALPVGLLREDPQNARKHSERNLATIRDSLRRFGQDQPLVAKNGPTANPETGETLESPYQLIKGHGRLAAAKALGWTHVAVLLVDDSEVEATLRSLSDNRSAELAEWDYRTLSGVFKGLKEQGTPLEGIGWQPFELAPLLTANWDHSAHWSGEVSKAPVPYTPNLAPTTSQAEVTPEDVEKRRKELNERLGQKSGMIAVTCPKCSEEFHIQKDQSYD